MATKKQTRVVEFVWEGINQKRVTAGGEIEAPSVAQARALLRQRGLRVTKIKRKPRPLFQTQNQ